MYANERCIAVKKTQKHVSLKRKCRHKQWTVRRVEWAGACGSPIDFRGHASMARRCMCALCVSEKKQDTHQGIPVCGVYCGEGCSCLLCVCVCLWSQSQSSGTGEPICWGKEGGHLICGAWESSTEHLITAPDLVLVPAGGAASVFHNPCLGAPSLGRPDKTNPLRSYWSLLSSSMLLSVDSSLLIALLP